MTVYCYPLFAINILNIYLFIFFILFRFLIFESCTAEFRRAKLEIRFPFWLWGQISLRQVHSYVF